MVAAVAFPNSLLCEESISVSDSDAATIFGLDWLATSAERAEDPRRDEPCRVDCALDFGDCMTLLLSQEQVGRYLPCQLFVQHLLFEQPSAPSLLELRRGTVLWTLKMQRSLRLDVSVAGSAVSMMDRFISASCSSCQLQSSQMLLQTDLGQLDMKLVGIACLWVAAKYSGNQVLDFRQLQAAAMIEYDAASIRRMELLVLRSLGWSAATLTPHDFIFNAIQHLTTTIAFPQNTVEYFLSRADELVAGLLPEAAFLQYQPSVISTCILQCVLDESIPLHSGDFMDCLRTTLAVDMISAWDCYQLLMDCVVDPTDLCAAPSPDHVAGVHHSDLRVRNK